MATSIELPGTTLTSLTNSVERQSTALTSLTDSVERQSTALTSLTDSVERQSTALTSLAASVERQGSTLTSLDASIQHQSSALTSLAASVERQGSTLTSLDASIQHQSTALTSLAASVERQGSTLTSLDASIERQSTTLAAHSATLSTVAATLERVALLLATPPHGQRTGRSPLSGSSTPSAFPGSAGAEGGSGSQTPPGTPTSKAHLLSVYGDSAPFVVPAELAHVSAASVNSRTLPLPTQERLFVHRLNTLPRYSDCSFSLGEGLFGVNVLPTPNKGLSFFTVLSDSPGVLAAMHAMKGKGLSNHKGCVFWRLSDLPASLSLTFDKVSECTPAGVPIVLHATVSPSEEMPLAGFQEALKFWAKPMPCALKAAGDAPTLSTSLCGSDVFSPQSLAYLKSTLAGIARDREDAPPTTEYTSCI